MVRFPFLLFRFFFLFFFLCHWLFTETLSLVLWNIQKPGFAFSCGVTPLVSLLCFSFPYITWKWKFALDTWLSSDSKYLISASSFILDTVSSGSIFIDAKLRLISRFKDQQAWPLHCKFLNQPFNYSYSIHWSLLPGLFISLRIINSYFF